MTAAAAVVVLMVVVQQALLLQLPQLQMNLLPRTLATATAALVLVSARGPQSRCR